MPSITRLVSCLLLCALLPACDGGGNSGGDPIDSGTPDATPITGATAKGVAAAAEAAARELEADILLYRIQGERLNGGTDVDLATLQSFWQYNFISPTTGIAVDVTYSLGELTAQEHPDNPEGKKLFPGPEWLDSSGAVDKMVQAGFSVPTEADTYTWMNATLEMYGGDDPVLSTFTDPIWRVTKLTQAPGMEVHGEEWWVAAIPDGTWLVCVMSATPTCYVLT